MTVDPDPKLEIRNPKLLVPLPNPALETRNPETAPAEGDPETAPSDGPPAPRRRRYRRYARRGGRPSGFTEEAADIMYEAILTTGVSDSRAASYAKVSTSAAWRWKQEIPKFAEFLKIARAKFEFAQIKTVRDTKCRDPRDEVRNAKWLLQNSSSDRFRKRPAPPKQRRRTTG